MSEQVGMLRELCLATRDHLELMEIYSEAQSPDHSQPVWLQSGLRVDPWLIQYRAVEREHHQVETHTTDR
jgi:hypothetical protein